MTPPEENMGTMPENYPDTVIDKVGYSAHVLVNDLRDIGVAIQRLNRLDRLLYVTEKGGAELPGIILNNELRLALEPLLRLRADINEIVDWLLPIYRETKQKTK